MKNTDSFIISALLSFSGGLQDAYTYNIRDHVFANAQTGNIVLTSHNIMMGNFNQAIEHFMPVIAFILGVAVSVFIEYSLRNSSKLSWKHMVIIFEIIALTIVGFIPGRYYLIPNMLVSFSCAMQVHTFKEIHGNRYASTMCIGNMTAATESFGSYLFNKDPKDLMRSLNLLLVITIFAIGAGFGGIMSEITKTETIWFSSAILAITGMLLNKE